jgi:amino acid permease
MNVLALIDPNPVDSPPPPFNNRHIEPEYIRMFHETIRDHTQWGTMREQSKGLSHPDTLYSYLLVAQAHFFLGHYAQAQPLLEQIFMLSDKAHTTLIVRVAIMLHYIYSTWGYKKGLRALKKKALARPSLGQ